MSHLVRVATTDDIRPGQTRLVEAEGLPVLVCHTGGRYYAISAVCPHEEGPLQDGSLVGERVVCPVHGYDFDVRTGECRFDSDYRVVTYPVTVRGDDLYVEVP